MKTCTKCGVEKPLKQFYKALNGTDRLRGDCKACVGEQRRAYRLINREREIERSRAWYEANREREIEKQRAWNKANPEKRAKTNARMRTKYPDRHAARTAVYNAVKLGKLAPARDITCACGSPAEQYHHHLGYAPEHRLDVVPVCIPCHTKLHREA